MSVFAVTDFQGLVIKYSAVLTETPFFPVDFTSQIADIKTSTGLHMHGPICQLVCKLDKQIKKIIMTSFTKLSVSVFVGVG